jgi:hypothetical protein
LIGALSVFVLGGADFSSTSTAPSQSASAVEILLGCIVLVAAARALRRRRGHTASAETPKWLGRLDQTNWLLALPLGAFMLTYSLTIAAAAEILKSDVSKVDGIIAFGVFALASITTIVAPIVVDLAAPERSAQRLEHWRQWLLGNSRTIGLVALMVIGAILIARGINDLVG